MIRYGFGLFIGLTLCLLGMMLESKHAIPITAFASFVIALGTTLGYGMIVFSNSSIERTVLFAIGRITCKESELIESREVARNLGKAAMVSGVLGATLALVHLINQMPNFENIGPASVASIIFVLYGITGRYIISEPLMNRINEELLAAKEENESKLRSSHDNHNPSAIAS